MASPHHRDHGEGGSLASNQCAGTTRRASGSAAIVPDVRYPTDAPDTVTGSGLAASLYEV
jgi:hypothetical protein